MSNYDPFAPFVSQMAPRSRELLERASTVNLMDAPGTRKFMDAKLELQRVNWAGTIALQTRHGLLKKVTSKI